MIDVSSFEDGKLGTIVCEDMLKRKTLLAFVSSATLAIVLFVCTYYYVILQLLKSLVRAALSIPQHDAC